jgi:hypothetical protein
MTVGGIDKVVRGLGLAKLLELLKRNPKLS